MFCTVTNTRTVSKKRSTVKSRSFLESNSSLRPLIDFPSVFTGQIGEPSLSATLEDHIIKDIVEDELWNSGATGGFKTSDERGLFTQAGVNISHAVDNDS